ncbi:hypothetical protein [Nitrosococcus watsonii]
MSSRWSLFVIQSRDPLDHAVFQAVFGNLMTLLIVFPCSWERVLAVTGAG